MLADVKALALAFVLAGTHALQGALHFTASPAPLAPPKDHPSVLVHHATDDKGGNTSLRFMANRKVDENKYPTNSVTVFAKAAREQPQRDRDLGQTFLTGDKGGRLDALFLRVGHADLAILPSTPDARVAVQWFEVTGEPRLNDHATAGFAGKFDRLTSPELDDYLEGETYTPLRVVEGRLPVALNTSDYLKLDFTGDDEFVLEPGHTYAFLLMFVDRAPLRGMTLANEYYGTYTPNPANKFRGHGIRREGLPAFPDDWKARLAQAPGTLGFPDVCTFRDLHFAITVKGVETSTPAYAITDPMEYFAESTEAFFSRNDFFPFTGDELQAHDPEMFALVAKLWGVPERNGSARRQRKAEP